MIYYKVVKNFNGVLSSFVVSGSKSYEYFEGKETKENGSGIGIFIYDTLYNAVRFACTQQIGSYETEIWECSAENVRYADEGARFFPEGTMLADSITLNRKAQSFENFPKRDEVSSKLISEGYLILGSCLFYVQKFVEGEKVRFFLLHSFTERLTGMFENMDTVVDYVMKNIDTLYFRDYFNHKVIKNL